MFQDITLENWRALKDDGGITTIDVRSPSEFRSATIPGSLNIPLFDDEERAEIGTLYKQVSVEAAKQRGLEIVSAKLPAFIREFAGVPGKKAVFCWRGGMRSKTTATVLSLMGIHAYRLNGGYRAYRQYVVAELETMAFAPRAVVLHGNTGSGKTEILRRLKAQGRPVLDLEGMAGHRGSIFGEIGLHATNQKMFDALLLEELWATRNEPFFAVEAESRRVGKVVLPELVMRKKEAGVGILIELPLRERVLHIVGDYKPWENPEACLTAFKRIKARLHTPIAHEIQSCLEKESYEKAVELLLVHYYDPRYAHSAEQYEEAPRYVVRAGSVEEAYRETERILGELREQPALAGEH
ncbi:tRNA 2-selenouridine(34) synthase MnmH [Paenibacillus sp. MWE-103]|uniref:tRNA 2-selenouridine(34) synthase MnmH n=1 Tax=Paenibacillus artemisiicola TaxID=1172618 RepID=A0ABS3W300_9BACL|nr:tRNA 2-selenouridine(34) synthase MnmH [Paenibacillus artemisiicola]MBO7742684.1 tRNA 2-selenouridine(34) synthase MnmH [Paenibacillus artemisiicola]